MSEPPLRLDLLASPSQLPDIFEPGYETDAELENQSLIPSHFNQNSSSYDGRNSSSERNTSQHYVALPDYRVSNKSSCTSILLVCLCIILSLIVAMQNFKIIEIIKQG